MSKNPEVFILLGTNLGNRTDNLLRARQLIGQVGSAVQTSALYETAAWGVLEQPSFYNQVLWIESPLSHEPLLHALQRFEQQMGKVKVGHWRERLIDLDILYYGQRRVNTSFLTVPHPQLHLRRFTLVPLCEIAPQWVHPVLGKTQQQLLAECEDTLKVRRI